MTDSLREEILTLTRDIVRQYWNKDLTILSQHVHPDIVWIGSLEREYLHGRKNFIDALEKYINDAPIVHLDDEHYEIALATDDVCIIAGSYRCFTTPDTGLVLSERQRISYVWTVEQGVPLIRHLHVSNTLHIQDEDENFPIRAGREAYLYMEQLVDQQNVLKSVSFRDAGGNVYVLNPDDVLSVTADRNYTILTRADGQADLRCRMSFSSVMEVLPPIFLRISRSMALNIHYIDHLERHQICLVNRKCYPIPVRRHSEIRELMAEMNRRGL